MRSTLFALFASAVLVAGQEVTTTSSSSSAASTTSSTPRAPVAHLVTVGGPGGQPLKFEPEFVWAEIGDQVIFEFRQRNHTVTQSSFAEPCTHFTDPETGAKGLDSGFVPVPEGSQVFPGWALNVTTKAPTWFYCRQGTHCTSGMLFSINCPRTGNTFDAFRANALALASSSVTPTWTETQTARWSGVGVQAQYSTGVTTPTALAQSTAASSSSAGPAGPTSSSTTDAATGADAQIGWLSAAVIALFSAVFAI